jgi:hypothetical protein
MNTSKTTCIDCNRLGVPVEARQRCKGCYNRYWRLNLATATQLEREKNTRQAWYEDNHSVMLVEYARRKKEKREILGQYKLKLGCIDCGYNKNPVALDFDHVGEKLFGIAESVKSQSMETIMEEVLKCEVRCANCHRIKTQERRLKWTQ